MNNTGQSLPILTVSQLSNAIKHCLEGTFPLVCLQGEVSNSKLHTSGHFYFSLKDSMAQISAVMFRPDAATMSTMPKDGMQVLVKGEINVYPQGGRYQILVKEMRPVGLGELLLKLEELKIKLHKKGWFKTDRKRPLPKFPRKIGVVTSPTGAAIQDMLNVLTRRFSGFHLIINPVRVQGEGAAQEIAQAIQQFNQQNLVDVVIVGRGGGSIEDLWAFNEEIVAEAIFNSKIPIISAVGHETDHCIADYVADVRAPTPSAAAEIVIAEKAHQLHHLEQLKKRLQHSLTHLVRKDRQRLNSIAKLPLLQTPFGILGPWIQKLDDMREDIDHLVRRQMEKKYMLLESRQRLLQSLKPITQIQHFKHKLGYWDKSVKTAFSMQLKRRRERLESLVQALMSVDPKNLLTKGYCILFSEKDHSAITSVHNVKKHQELRVLLSDGEILSTVKEIISSERPN